MIRFKLLSLFLVVASASIAQNGLLWKISHPKTEANGYLFGTMHMIPKSKFSPAPLIDSLIRESENVVTEIGLDLFLEERFDLATSMVFENRKSLEDHITKEKLARLKRVLVDTLGIDEGRLENQYFNLRPMFMTTILLKELLGPTEAYDEWVWEMAKQHEKKVVGLESVYQQIGFIDSIPLEMQLSWLDDLNSKMVSEYYEMLDVYQTGDIDSLLKVAQLTSNSEADLQLRSLRNQNWVPRMKDQMAKGNTFFAVGALHLPGRKGLLELLRKEGFSAKPLAQ